MFRALSIGLTVGALLCASALSSDRSTAAPIDAPQTIAETAIDVDTAGNSPTSVGLTQSCNTSPLSVGDRFYIDLVARGVPPYETYQSLDRGTLVGFSLDLLYDPAVVQVIGAQDRVDLANNTAWGDDPTDTDGEFRLDYSRTYGLPQGDLLIIRFKLIAVGTGVSALELADTGGGLYYPAVIGQPNVLDADSDYYDVSTVKNADVAVGVPCTSNGPARTVTISTTPEVVPAGQAGSYDIFIDSPNRPLSSFDVHVATGYSPWPADFPSTTCEPVAFSSCQSNSFGWEITNQPGTNISGHSKIATIHFATDNSGSTRRPQLDGTVVPVEGVRMLGKMDPGLITVVGPIAAVPPNGQGAEIELRADSGTTTVGGMVTVDIWLVSGPAPRKVLLSFNSDVLRASSCTPAPPVWCAANFWNRSVVFGMPYGAQLQPTGFLGSVTFEGQRVGLSPLTPINLIPYERGWESSIAVNPPEAASETPTGGAVGGLSELVVSSGEGRWPSLELVAAFVGVGVVALAGGAWYVRRHSSGVR